MRCLLSKWKLKSAYLRHPGRVIDVQKLSNFFSAESIDFLSLQHNEHGWGCRWEWVSKHLAAKAARNNVTFLTRTRILSLINIQENITFSICPTTSVIFLIASRSIMLSQCPRTHSLALGNVVTPSISTTFNTTPFHPAVPGSVGRSPTSSLPTSIKRILFSHAATD